MGKTQHSTIETSPDAYNNQPSCQYMCMVMVANEIDEAVDVRLLIGKNSTTTTILSSRQCQLVAANITINHRDIAYTTINV